MYSYAAQPGTFFHTILLLALNSRRTLIEGLLGFRITKLQVIDINAKHANTLLIWTLLAVGMLVVSWLDSMSLHITNFSTHKYKHFTLHYTTPMHARTHTEAKSKAKSEVSSCH